MAILRTPDAAFENLPGYDFAPNYVELSDPDLGALRMHYVDEGPADGPVILLFHGEPSWSYLYRKMIPPLVAAGFRCLAPDLIGFGKSDKPDDRKDYTYAKHLSWLIQWMDALDLPPATLFCQDWGGLLGLRLVADHSERFAAVAASNTGLPAGGGQANDAFLAWRTFSQEVPEFPTGQIISQATVTDLDPAVQAAYDAPYPDESYKEGARAFPPLVPISDDIPQAAENREAWKRLSQFDKPFLTCFGDSDPVSAGGDKILQQQIKGATGQDHTIVEKTGHFCQEDSGEALAEIVIAFARKNGIL